MDEKGLRYSIELPDTQLGRDVAVLVARGDIIGSSFSADGTERYAFEGDRQVVYLENIQVKEVGPVVTPAYESTEAYLRSIDEAEQAYKAEMAQRKRRLRYIEISL
jgi:HK97 family phage prohead protease